MDCFPEFHGNSFSNSSHRSSLAYKPYPRGPEFHGKSWIFYGNFMEKLGPILDLYEISRENLWKIHGFSWIFPWKTRGAADP
jgi:hypothetical protein